MTVMMRMMMIGNVCALEHAEKISTTFDVDAFASLINTQIIDEQSHCEGGGTAAAGRFI